MHRLTQFMPLNWSIQLSIFANSYDGFIVGEISWYRRRFESLPMQSSTAEHIYIYIIKCIDETCQWWLRANRMNDSPCFRIRKYYPSNLCSLNNLERDHRQASSILIANETKHKLEGALSSNWSETADIQQDIFKTIWVLYELF